LAVPTYLYAVVKPDGSDGAMFEVVQRMREAALTTHPETGEPVRRVPTPPNIGGGWSDAGTKSKLGDKNLSRLGFTKYVNAGGGKFEKAAGSGPGQISA
jgi:predicted nucleic acid-binding Zn ribbon protein